jgi:Putative beta-barrel porin-2, OmpL-like. bbp2
MNNQPNNIGLIKPLVLAIAALPALCVAEAKPLTEASTLLEAMGDPNDSSLMKKSGLKVGGWLNGGVTYNANDPSNKFNGPTTFGDRSAEPQINQLNLFIQRAVATEGDSWDVGGRFDFMFGTDSIFTQAYGVPAFDVNTGQPLKRGSWDLNFLGANDNRFYDIALPQAYAEAYVPVGNGLNVKAGHFYTPIGYETVPAPDNFFYTHAYTMQYGEPFTHTGVMGNYAVDSNWSVMGGVVTGSATGGWDGNFNKQLGNWSGLMGATWTSTDKNTSFNASGTYGGTSEHSNQGWGIYSLVLKHNITDKFHMVLQHDHGYANNVVTSSASPNIPVDAEWYGINTHWTYDVLDNLAAGVRAEWFRDQKGFRVCSPGRVSAATDGNGNSYATGGANTSGCTAGSYYAVTAGVNWKPVKWLNVRPNVRYDWVDASTFAGSGSTLGPFGDGNNDQFLFSTDFNINF